MTNHTIPLKLDAERKELIRLQRLKDQREVALPRTFVKPGIYTGQEMTKAYRRDGSFDLHNAPSLFANTLIYKDGTRKEFT